MEDEGAEVGHGEVLYTLLVMVFVVLEDRGEIIFFR